MKIRARKKAPQLDFDPSLMYSLEKMHLVNEEKENTSVPAMKECVEALPTEQKNCIKWFYYEDRSYKEIAEIEKLPLGKVRSHIQNGRRNLKNCVEQKTLKNESKR